MLKEAVASKAAKLLMTCVCPVAGTTALTLGVPQVRDAVHKAVQPRQYAKPKTRVRAPGEAAPQIASADCATTTPVGVGELGNPVPATPVGTEPAQVAEVPQPESGVPLTRRIFVPRTDTLQPAKQADGSDPAAWVQLLLGFGLVGIPRVTYRRNGTRPEGDAEA